MACISIHVHIDICYCRPSFLLKTSPGPGMSSFCRVSVVRLLGQNPQIALQMGHLGFRQRLAGVRLRFSVPIFLSLGTYSEQPAVAS